ncbi:hypothetical protein EYF80_023183 [Liparis tanakae]|uniref:Uncharacterized protein n=1 Tax=Liparis tanakae TaxID=230148 RepID=A0A4Z2HL71_9TELE|nr:hypothetical protein EYF80_023183 [Liparis tanakae]
MLSAATIHSALRPRLYSTRKAVIGDPPLALGIQVTYTELSVAMEMVGRGCFNGVYVGVESPVVGLTLAGAEGEHGRLALARRAASDHQHLVETGGLELRQPQGLLTARDPDPGRLTAPPSSSVRKRSRPSSLCMGWSDGEASSSTAAAVEPS